MKKMKDWMKNHKIATGLIIVLGLGVFGNLSEDSVEKSKVEQATSTQEKQDKTTQTDEKNKKQVEKDDVPREYKNALEKAESYLDYSSFSKKGLVKQLEYEKFSSEAIDYAIKNAVVDWNKECLEKAESYLDYSSFSDEGLKDQLRYEEFTEKQIQYAMDNLK